MIKRGLPMEERLLNKCMPEPNSGCWLWTDHLGPKGYAKIYDPESKLSRSAHRISFKLFVGPIPKGLHILHTCDNPLCINPKHLYAGTNQQNINDKMARNRWKNGNMSKTECSYGHQFSAGNTLTILDKRTNRTYRRCKNCFEKQAVKSHARFSEKRRQKRNQSGSP